MTCREWVVIHTHQTGFVDTFVAEEDYVLVPPSAYGVLQMAVAQVAEDAVAKLWLPKDADAPADFPKTTVTIIVCLRPVRVLLTPADLWAPASMYAQ